MLAQEQLVAFLATADAAAARAFYEGVLGLTFVTDHEHLMVFESGSSRVSLQKTDGVVPPRGTAMGWHVQDIRASIRDLTARGVTFERFDGMDQDELGVWSPAGPATGVAWFKDPDGNLLSLSQGG
ncbi:MAG TPA: VOC family protein [Caulobacteraceae bacterium]|jgi:catechol 2,3-dioxygenase-like lactoylglutathione lyase family enzyme|nr:VOC family protein [Caulobacteraceae bacterium]